MKKKGSKAKTRKLPTVLTKDELNKLFSVIDNYRDMILIKFIYYTGCRVNEAMQIKKTDINFREKLITFRAETTKRKKERHQPIPSIFVKPLLHYVQMIGDEASLFPITKQRAWQIIKKYAKRAKINKNVHPHTLRHSYATHIYEDKKDIKLVQELLGHSDTSTTSIYTHLDNKSKQEGIEGVF